MAVPWPRVGLPAVTPTFGKYTVAISRQHFWKPFHDILHQKTLNFSFLMVSNGVSYSFNVKYDNFLMKNLKKLPASSSTFSTIANIFQCKIHTANLVRLAPGEFFFLPKQLIYAGHGVIWVRLHANLVTSFERHFSRWRRRESAATEML